jgi:hypothetical protein
VREVFKAGECVASFVVTPPPRNETLFIGLYIVGSVRKCETGEADSVTGEDLTGCYQYEMAYDGRLDEYKGRLSVDWGTGHMSSWPLTNPRPSRLCGITRIGHSRHSASSASMSTRSWASTRLAEPAKRDQRHLPARRQGHRPAVHRLSQGGGQPAGPLLRLRTHRSRRECGAEEPARSQISGIHTPDHRPAAARREARADRELVEA